MARFIPPHPKKGSPAAYAWAARMRAAWKKGGSRRIRKTNPGALWHAKKRRETTRQERAAGPKWQKDFFHGKATAHLESALAAKAMGMNPGLAPGNSQEITKDQVRKMLKGTGKRLPQPERAVIVTEPVSYGGKTYGVVNRGGRFFAVQYTPNSTPHRARAKRNPLVVYGLGNPGGAKVAGVLYNRIREIRAEKTGSFEPGLYKHPFSRSARVCALALDNGDILIHSKANKPLWRRA